MSYIVQIKVENESIKWYLDLFKDGAVHAHGDRNKAYKFPDKDTANEYINRFYSLTGYKITHKIIRIRKEKSNE